MLILPSRHPDTLVYLCRRQQDKVLVLFNFSKDEVICNLDHPALPGQYVDLFSNEPVAVERRGSFKLAPGGFKYYHITSGDAGW